MPNNFTPNISPIWGVPLHMSVADFKHNQAANNVIPIPAVFQAYTTTRSNVLPLQARGLFLGIALQNETVVFDINLYTSISGVDNLVYNATGITYQTKDSYLFIGNLEFVDLQGQPIKIEVANPTGGWVSITVSANS